MENDNKEIEALNENFSYNSMLARALVQLFAQEVSCRIFLTQRVGFVPTDGTINLSLLLLFDIISLKVTLFVSYCYILIVYCLSDYETFGERAQIHMWLEKLQRVPRDDVDAMIIRNEYMWLLLLVMQSGNLTEPFNKLPPCAEELPPVSDIMPTRIYQEVLGSSEQNFSWIDKVLSETNAAAAAAAAGGEDDKDNDVKVGIAPYTFLDHQPRPLNGIACYFSVFSNKS